MSKSVKEFTTAEVSGSKDTLVILHGQVYDLTAFVQHHPGGEDAILEHKGLDATADFESIGHPKGALKKVEKFVVGSIKK